MSAFFRICVRELSPTIHADEKILVSSLFESDLRFHNEMALRVRLTVTCSMGKSSQPSVACSSLPSIFYRSIIVVFGIVFCSVYHMSVIGTLSSPTLIASGVPSVNGSSHSSVA